MTAVPPGVAIAVEGLRKSYGEIEAVRGISFAVRAGTTTALLGGNGAGKTTTLSMLLGVLTPSAGRVTVLMAVVSAGEMRPTGNAFPGTSCGWGESSGAR